MLSQDKRHCPCLVLGALRSRRNGQGLFGRTASLRAQRAAQEILGDVSVSVSTYCDSQPGV